MPVSRQPFEALYGRKCQSLVCIGPKFGDVKITGLEIERTHESIHSRIDRECSQRLTTLIASCKRPAEKLCQYKMKKLNPLKVIGPQKSLNGLDILVAYKLELHEELSNVHSTFHIFNLKKCLSDKSLVIPMKELRLDGKLNFVEELVEIMDREFKQLKQSRIPIVKDAPEFCEFFEINYLKAQLQAKTTLICNLKNQIKSVKEASNEAKVKHEIDVLETINIELESSVAKLLTENEKFNKENEHLKQTYKELYDSIKKTRIQTKDQNDSLIAQVNNKTVENADLKAQI
ncbi:hypothetical protein Tco_1555207 [Tanacetum coccineum]